MGEADEEFVYETRLGDRFLLGAFGWKVTNIGRDTVTVTQASAEGARVPFWKGELKGRGKETGTLFGQIFRELQEAEEDGRLEEALGELGLDEAAVLLAAGYLRRQMAATGGLPNDRIILAEHFRDQSGNSQLMIHSVFGKRINGPLALLAAQAAREETGLDVGSVDEEDGLLLYAYGDKPLPEGLLGRLSPETVLPRLSAMLPATPLFNIAFRYNCGRALMMGVKGSGRHPLWMQRLRSAEMLNQIIGQQEHPLIRETRQECLHQLWDAEGVRDLLLRIRSGEILVREIYTDTPSPMSLPLQWSQEAAVMYDYAPTSRGVHRAMEDALREELKGERELVQPGAAELSQVQARERLPQDQKQLHSLLMAEGDLAAGELDVPVEWLEELAVQGRALYLEQGLWIAAEQKEEYSAMLETFEMETAIPIIRRMLRYRGGVSVLQTARRYGLSEEAAENVLKELCRKEEAVAREETEGDCREVRYYHGELYRRARSKTLRNRREEIATCGSDAYAALVLSRIQRAAAPEECLKMAIAALAGTKLPAGMWEELVLPSRVKNYRETLLDGFLAAGEYFWHLGQEGKLEFVPGEQVDWDSAPRCPGSF